MRGPAGRLGRSEPHPSRCKAYFFFFFTAFLAFFAVFFAFLAIISSWG
jgi:hypothetical protein